MLHTLGPAHQSRVTKPTPRLNLMIITDPALHGWSVKLAFIVGKTEMLSQVIFTEKGALLSRLFRTETVIVAF